MSCSVLRSNPKPADCNPPAISLKLVQARSEQRWGRHSCLPRVDVLIRPNHVRDTIPAMHGKPPTTDFPPAKIVDPDDLDPDLPDVDDSVPPDEGDEDEFDRDRGDPARWITVATFWQPTEAHISRLKLESEDIPCVLLDENLVATDWLYANAAGGIKLQVPQEDAERATNLLETTTSKSLARPDPEPLFDGQACCSRCGSSDIYRTRYSKRWSFLSILLLGLPLPIRLARMRCAACGLEWK